MFFKGIRVFAAATLASALAIVGCNGGDGGGKGGDGGDGGGEPTCDSSTQGFVECGSGAGAVKCQPGTYCSDPTFAECSDGCVSNANCGCGETCVNGSCVIECVAGAHSGVITRTGGAVTIEIVPGVSAYPSTTRNGIISNGFGAYTGSFLVVP